jgi:hypothetical protein
MATSVRSAHGSSARFLAIPVIAIVVIGLVVWGVAPVGLGVLLFIGFSAVIVDNGGNNGIDR